MSGRPVVIGAGPAGLAVGATLKAAGLEPLLLDRAGEPGSSWRSHYDRLRLHTARSLSQLPGFRMPPSLGRWVRRDDVAEYLRRYARHHRLDIRLDTEVRGLRRGDGGWVVDTGADNLHAGVVVVATGYNREPVLPDLPGMGSFERPLVHASAYRNPEPYRGKRILVIGSGNSGAEIAADLAEGGAARVWWSIRTGPTIFPRDIAGVPSQLIGIAFRHLPSPVADALVRPGQRLLMGDLARHGVPNPPPDPYSHFRRTDVVPILDVGVVAAVRAGAVEVVPATEGFDGAEVLTEGGGRLRPDAVIAATGYRRGLEPLVGHLGVLDDHGRPRAHGGQSDPRAPGLYFIGFTNPISGNFRELGIDARRIARAVARGAGV